MEIKERKAGDVTILDVKGKLSLAEGDLVLKDKIHSLVQSGNLKVLLNLADVSYIDSSALGVMVSGYTTMKRAGGKLSLLHLTKRSHELMVITKLVDVFDFFDSEKEAVESFAA